MMAAEIVLASLIIAQLGIVAVILTVIGNQIILLRRQVASAAGLLQRVVQPRKQKQQQQPQVVQYVPRQVQQQAQQGDEEYEEEEEPYVPPWLHGIAQSVGLNAELLAMGDPLELQKAQQLVAQIKQGRQEGEAVI